MASFEASRRALPRLLVITDFAVADPARTLEIARAILAVVPRGSCAFSIRDHDAEVRVRARLGRALRGPTRDAGALLFVHDRVDLARVVDADGVHLGRRSLAIRDALSVLGDDALVGVSCHDESELARAVEDGASYATLSPLFASPGKDAPLGEARFRAIAERFASFPILALGGCDATNAMRARACGAHGLATIRGVLTAGDPAATAAEIVRAMTCE